MKETKRQRFVRIAEARTNKIIALIRLLGNLSNKGNYDYADEDVRKIFNALDKEIKQSKNSFLGIESIEQRFKLE